MMTSALLRVFEAFLASMALISNTEAKSNASTRPNILFIMVDDQDHLMKSLDFMPNVRSNIAQYGTTFNKHYCTTALCCPSRASTLTGKCVHNINVTSVVTPYGGYPKFISEGLNDDYLPVWLQDGDINTYYVGKFLNSHKITNYRSPKLNGWTSSNFLLEPGTYDYLNTTWAEDFGDWKSHPGTNAIDITTQHALDMLDKAAKGDSPFFLQVSPAIPHNGINASDGSTFFPIPNSKWANAFQDKAVPRTPNFNPETVKTGASWIQDLPYQDEATVNKLDELYRARVRCIAGLDDMVGALIDKLDDHGILENTHVIYTSDNGYHIGQHRLGPGKLTGYETDINVPLLWRGPGVSANTTVDAVSSHTDLAPTFLDIFGLSSRSNFDGQLIPATRDGTDVVAGEHVNVENWQNAAPYEVSGFHSIASTIQGSGNNTYKGVRIFGTDHSYYYSVWCTNQRELYDMKSDIYQAHNILAGVASVSDISDDDTKKLVHRLDAVLMVLKSCTGDECTKPWSKLHPQGDVTNLKDALDSKFDSFYASQAKIHFSACKSGYLLEYEGPQDYSGYGTS